jgi:tetratricopeptide (TPR) repeat protein
VSDRIEIFCAYAQSDEEWVKELEKRLKPFEDQRVISLWSSRLIAAGEDWKLVTEKHLQRASIILLLISPDFLAFDYRYGPEMKQALDQALEKLVRIIPILLRPVDWPHVPFGHLEPLPPNATFILQRDNRDQAFVEVVAGIRRAIENVAASFARTDFPSIWNVPFPRNLFFIGREDLLAQLHTQLQQGQTAALSQAISGLGGVGKTQLAVEYAYRYYQEYQAVLWVHAESVEVLTTSYTEIATLLNLPVKEEPEQAIIIQGVKAWLQNHRDWLLILDNADELDILPAFLPPRLGGHVIITTRAIAPGRFAQRLLVETFPQEQGILFLLRRAGLIALNADASQASPENQALAELIMREMGGLPLALDQIGAYLETTGSSLAAYWQLYQQHRVDLLKDYRGLLVDHPPIATTWSLSIARVEERNPAAVDLLRLCAYLSPDAIGEDILIQGADTLPPTLSTTVADGYLLDQAIEALRAYSLIIRDTQARALVVHRLIQTVVRDSLPAEIQKQWTQYVVALINQAFLDVEFASWPQCEHCLPHALLCAQWIKQERMVTPEAMHLLDQLGYYLTLRGRYSEAEPFLLQALSIHEQQLGFEHLDTATSLYHLALLYRHQGKYTQAEPLFQRALSIREQQLGASHPDTAMSLYDLAVLYEVQAKYAEAETLYLRALTIQEHTLGPQHADFAKTLDDLGVLHRAQGKYAQAEQFYQRALAIREQVLGPSHPDLARSLDSLAVLYYDQGKHQQAESLYQRTLAIQEQALGPHHPDVATTLNNLAGLYYEQKKYDQAEPLHQRALEIREQILGPHHPDVATTLNHLAGLSIHRGNYNQAISFLERALTIREETFGPDHPRVASTQSNLASLYIRQGKYAQAELLLQRSLLTREQVLGPQHPDVAHSLINLARLYYAQGKNEEGEPLYQRALAIEEAAFGPQRPLVIQHICGLADLYSDEGKDAQAKALYQRALTLGEQALGSQHPDVVSIREKYTRLLQRESREE